MRLPSVRQSGCKASLKITQTAAAAYDASGRPIGLSSDKKAFLFLSIEKEKIMQMIPVEKKNKKSTNRDFLPLFGVFYYLPERFWISVEGIPFSRLFRGPSHRCNEDLLKNVNFK